MVSERTVGGPDLEFRERFPGCCHERLLGDAPCGGERREGAPPVLADKTGGTVVTEIGLEEIALLEVIVDAAEERAQRHLGPAAGVVLELVVAAGADDLVVGIGELLPVCPEAVIVIFFVRCAEEQFEAVAPELTGRRRGRMVIAVPRCGDRLVEGVVFRIGGL